MWVVATAVATVVSCQSSAPSRELFAQPVTYSIAGYAWSIALGDLDQDGVADLAVGYGGPPQGSVSVFRNHGDGTFAAPMDYLADGEPLSVAIGGLSASGAADLVTAN